MNYLMVFPLFSGQIRQKILILILSNFEPNNRKNMKYLFNLLLTSGCLYIKNVYSYFIDSAVIYQRNSFNLLKIYQWFRILLWSKFLECCYQYFDRPTHFFPYTCTSNTDLNWCALTFNWNLIMSRFFQ